MPTLERSGQLHLAFLLGYNAHYAGAVKLLRRSKEAGKAVEHQWSAFAPFKNRMPAERKSHQWEVESLLPKLLPGERTARHADWPEGTYVTSLGRTIVQGHACGKSGDSVPAEVGLAARAFLQKLAHRPSS